MIVGDETTPGRSNGSTVTIGMYHPKAGTRNSGGVSTFVRETVKRLPEFGQAYLYTESGDRTDELEASGVTVVETSPTDRRVVPTGLESLAERVPQEIAESLRFFASAARNGTIGHIDRHVDVLYTHGLADTLLLANAVDARVVRLFHALERAGVGGKSMRYLSPSAGVVANSRQTAAEITDKLGYDVDGIVYPGVDVEAFAPDSAPAFERDERVVLYVGRFVEQKGVFDLVEAFEAVADEAHLVLVGRGDERRLRRQIADLGIEASVTVEGTVPHERLPGYYAACDVFCLPSYYETFGLVNLEAMATGKPVLTTDVPGIEAYATHGETCWLVDPGDVEAIADGLRTLLESPALRERLGENARSVAEQYSWVESAADLVRVGEQLAEPERD
jgi:glycosyltransferase involved in cell wall biosynthesis